MSQLATRVLEIRADGITDYPGRYDEYVHACGDDHLDVDRVVLGRKKEDRRKEVSQRRKPAQPSADRPDPTRTLERLRRRLDPVTVRIADVEIRMREIDGRFCESDYFARTPADALRALEAERKDLQDELAGLMVEWEGIEHEIAALERAASRGEATST